MTVTEWNQIRNQVQDSMNEHRYQHTEGVMYTAASLAMRYGYNIEKAMLAGLLHDCGKCIPNENKIRLCKEHGETIEAFELENPELLHAKLGSILAKETYAINDAEILHAIRVHTTGCPDMNLLDKIIFVADYIEPHRANIPNLEEIRKIAFKDIDLGVLQILENTLRYLETRGCAIDPTTQITFDYYRAHKKESL